MKHLICMIFLAALGLSFTNVTYAQKKKKGKSVKEITPEQYENYRQSYKKMLLDSLPMTPEQADTTAAIEVDYQKKLFTISNSKDMDKDEKEMRTGMLDEAKENRLRYLLPGETFEKYFAMVKRQKIAYEQRQKEIKDAQNQQMSNTNSLRRGNYGGGYGGYGGYY